VAEIEQELRGRAHNTAIAALEVVPFAMLIADADARVLAVNGKWLELAGLTRANSLGPGWLSVLEPEARNRLRDEVRRVALEGEAATVDHQMGAAAAKRWTRWWMSRHELDGLPLVAIGVADVDEDYARQADLYHLATHDSLTGLVNRSHFLESIDQALRRNQRQSRHVAVVYVDLDGFKRVNDRGGHSLGDRVLYAIASRLRHAVRSADMVARIGGDEFAVLCEGLTAAEQADVVAGRIAVALTESVELDGERWSVAASVGAAVEQEPDSAEGLVDRADRAMYSVKLTRRGPGRGPEDVLRAAPEMALAGLRPERRTNPDPRPPFGFPERRADRRAAAGGDAPPRFVERRGSGVATAPERPGPPFGVPEDRPMAEPAGQEAPNLGGAAAVPGFEVLESDDARRALRTLTEQPAPPPSAPSFASGAQVPPAPPRAGGAVAAEGSEPGPSERAQAPISDQERAQDRLASDVLQLRESIDSIRGMLNRLLAADGDVIDIRDQPDR
jgi:diguanylate cyclase (GGDEF)-like protein/PAS domain S-box-containing protein